MTANRIEPGAILQPRELHNIRSERVRVPDRERLVHLQFRRFAGCPVCNLHLRSFVQRYSEVTAASIQEVIVFHSRQEESKRHASDLPFDVIADPEKRLYVDFGVEAAYGAIFDPRVWLPIVRGIGRSLLAIARGKGSFPSVNPNGGRFGLPADFLIAPDGAVLARKYGVHAYDHWSVDEMLAFGREGVTTRRRIPGNSNTRPRTVAH
jgi:peroxiredoxin